MKRQLSQQEIDAYFQSAATAQKASADSGVAFDFRRLDRIPKSQLTALHSLHETFVRAFSSSLSAYLRAFVSGSLISLEQLPYSDFAESLPSPTCMVYLSMHPFQGHTLVEVSPSLTLPILDLVLGGDGKVQADALRELTDVERTLIEGFFQILTHDLRETWKPVVEVALTISSIETSAQLSGRFAPTEAVVAMAIELRIGENVGLINVAIPSITLKIMGQRFDQQWTVHKSENPATETAIQKKLVRELKVTVECELSGLTIKLRDLLTLSRGDVLCTPPFDRPMDILVNGTPKFKARLSIDEKGRQAVIEQRCPS